MRETHLENQKKLIQLARQAVNQPDKLPEDFNNPNKQEIFELQKAKQLILNELKAELKIIDQGEGIIAARGEINRQTHYYAEKNIFYVDNQGSLEKATLGDLITDASYGIEYNLDVSSVPRNLVKKYCLAKARAKISRLFDIQLLAQAAEQKKRAGKYERASMFAMVKNKITSGEYIKNFEKSAGLIFEKNIINLVKQLEFDLPELEIKVEEVDIIKDMDEKIDFIISVKNIPHRRAVEVTEGQEKNKNKKRFGIQFTLNPKSINHKLDQISLSKKFGVREKEKIDDLLLVTVPVGSREIIKNYHEWKNNQRPAGGPERLFDSQTKIYFLKELLNKIGLNNIIEQHQDKLQTYYQSKQ